MKLSCKNVCFMVSESLDRRLSLRERISVKVHLLMCKACQRMARQMELLREASCRYASIEISKSRHEKETLSKSARARILVQLQHPAHEHE